MSWEATSDRINALPAAIGGNNSAGAKHARTANAMAESKAYLRCDECGRLSVATVEDLRRSPTARDYIHCDQVMRMLDHGAEKGYREALRELKDREHEARMAEYVAKKPEDHAALRRESKNRARLRWIEKKRQKQQEGTP